MDHKVARSETAFFMEPSTKDALRRLADAKHLVVFCGAGVTIDQTGMSWVALLEQVFTARSGMETAAKSMDWPQVASALFEKARIDAGAKRKEQQKAVTSRLASLLYPPQSSRWESGELVDSLAKLAVTAAVRGRSVTLITTNYDTHLEARVQEHVREQHRPRVKVVVAALEEERRPAKNGEVQIVYMHGRIPQNGKPTGRCVLTETDYAATRRSFSRRVSTLIRRSGSAMLILGSSLADPPLIDALASTVGQSKVPRVALYPLLPTSIYKHDDYEAALDLMHARCQHLDLDLLFPDFLFQVPEFCKELGLAIAAAIPSDHVDGDRRYGKRLDQWWQEFEPVLDKPELASEVLLETLNTVRDILSQKRHKAPKDEIYRLDLWLRDTPKDRHLVQWASSVGPIWERALLRRQELDLRSKHATVRGFQSGHPRLYTLDDLGLAEEDETMRWKHFLVVPVFDSIMDKAASPMLPVGAATLCASSSSPHTLLNANPKEMSLVVQILRDLAGVLRERSKTT